MFYIKGRVRKCKLFQLTHTLLIDSYFRQYQYLHLRLNSTINTETCTNTKRSFGSNNANQDHMSQLDVKYKAENLISFMVNNYKSNEFINSLFEFDYSIFKNYEDQWTIDEIKKDKMKFRFNQISSRLETIEYTTIPEIGKYLKEYKIIKMISLIIDKYNHNIYLTPNEFEKLVFDCYPYRSFVYKIVKLYAKKYDLSWFNDAVLKEMLFISYLNLDFKLFDQLFNKYILLIKELSPNILNIALEVYLRTENVTVASHFFAQYVITSENLPTYILETYLRSFFDATWNTKPCLEAYKLWLSRGFNTNESTDVFMLTLIRENGTEEELKWINRSLERRNRLDLLSIKWNSSLCLLDNSFSVYKQLMEPKNFKNFQQKTKNYQNSIFKKSLRDLHLKYQNFTAFIESVPSTVSSGREFGELTLKITQHLELQERPDLIINFFKILRRQTNFKFYFQHLILFWQSLIKKYPHLAREIQSSFRTQLKASKNQKYAFLLKVCTIRQNASIFKNVKRWYPRLYLVQVRSEFTAPEQPKLNNLELRLRNGIIPTNKILSKTLKMISVGDGYDRLLGIINEKTIQTESEDLSLDAEIFWKERRTGNWWSARRFMKDSFDKIETGRYKVKMCDLVKLFRLCVKFNLHQEAEQTLDYMNRLNVRFKSEDLLIFVFMLVKWYWVRKEYKEIVYIFEWFKNDEFPLLINEFFIENLVNVGEKHKRISIEEIEREKDEDDEMKEHKLDVIRQLMVYHNASIDQLKRKMEDDKKKLLIDIDKDWQRIVSWIDHDANEKVNLMKTL